MTVIIIVSALSFMVGWILSYASTFDVLMKKVIAWLKMSDYSDDDIERIVEEIKGIQL